MIKKECYTQDWIQKVTDKYEYPDVNLIEKVIHAFSLVELLSSSGRFTSHQYLLHHSYESVGHVAEGKVHADGGAQHCPSVRKCGVIVR